MKTRNRKIDGLRGVTAILIVCLHLFGRYAQIYLEADLPLVRFLARSGVIIFLLISSYYNVSAEKSSLRKLGKRILRLWPTYAAAVTIIFIILQFAPLPGRESSVRDYILNLFFLNGFLDTPYVDGAHWYLTTLVSIILCLGLIQMSKWRTSPYCYLSWMLLVLVMSEVLQNTILTSLLGGSYIGIVCICVWLKLGRGEKNPRLRIGWYLVLGSALLYTVLMLGLSSTAGLILVFPIVSMALDGHFSLLENKVLQFLGMISYPFYLIHQNIGFAIEYQLTRVIGEYHIYYAAIAFVITFGMAFLLYYIVEKNSLKLIKNI